MESIIIYQRLFTHKAGVYRSLIKFIDESTGSILDEIESHHSRCRLESAARSSLKEAREYIKDNFEADTVIVDSDILGHRDPRHKSDEAKFWAAYWTEKSGKVV